MPTPTGVPVAITSPGSSVMTALIASIRVGMSKIRSATAAFWRCSPLTQVVSTSFVGSGTSSAVRIAGPIGQKVSSPLPRIHWLWRFCRWRAVTSLTMV